jgi:hypothetical protein
VNPLREIVKQYDHNFDVITFESDFWRGLEF